MIKRNNKKGFTIVELVIVIAVIAILAAVLIPTFAGIIRKANISADTQLAKNLNTTLVADEAINGAPENFNDVLAAFRENGFVIANLNPTTNGCYFVWESTSNQILLVDAEDNFKVLYAAADDYAAIGNTWYFAVSDKETADALKAKNSDINVAMTIAAGNDLNAALGAITGTDTIYVDESLVIDKNSVIVLDNADAKITIDLGTSTVSGNNGGNYSVDNVPFMVKAGELTIEGGTISASGSYLDADGDPVDSSVIVENGVLNLSNTVVDGAGKDIIVAYSKNATGTVSNSTITAKNQAIGVFGGSSVVVENCTVNVNCEALFVSNNEGVSSATIKSGKYSGVGNTIVSHGGIIVIEDGEFSSTQYNLFKLYSTGGSITIKGGTFTNDNGSYTFDQLTENILADMVATTSTGTVTVTKNVDGSFTIAN